MNNIFRMVGGIIAIVVVIILIIVLIRAIA
jgi:hypothetical protein